MGNPVDTVLGYDLYVMLNSTSPAGAYNKLIKPTMQEVAEIDYPEEEVLSLDDWLSGKQVLNEQRDNP